MEIPQSLITLISVLSTSLVAILTPLISVKITAMNKEYETRLKSRDVISDTILFDLNNLTKSITRLAKTEYETMEEIRAIRKNRPRLFRFLSRDKTDLQRLQENNSNRKQHL